MQGFVSGRQRPGSPANGRPQGKPDRRANATSARISMQNGHPVQRPQEPSVIPTRGFNNAQNSSAVLQQPHQQRQSGPGPGPSQKRDLYDTDAESLDTTVNPSVVQVEDSQQKEQYYQQQDHVVNLGGTSETEGEDEDEYEERGDHFDEPRDDFEDDGHELLQQQQDLIRANGLEQLSHDEQLAFLQDAAAGGLPTVRGDSYPPTTNGEPSEWEGGQEAVSNFHHGAAPMSPSPLRQNVNHEPARMAASHAPQQQQMRNLPPASQNMHQPSGMFHHGALIREQSRAAAPPLQHGGQDVQQYAPAPHTSQRQIQQWNAPDTTANLPTHPNPRPSAQVQPSRSQQKPLRQASGPKTLLPPKNNITSVESHAPLQRLTPVQAIQGQVAQQQSEEQAPIEELQAVSHKDYDDKTLFKMSYNELKNESFDTDPRDRPSVLTEEQLQKPLAERLKLVQSNLDGDRQSDFFHSLPTTEWEDAGDWFLDQFQDIINRTKQARQKKRKLAQEFEADVEKRHEHVSKKQHQVQQAMNKMKEQGEGLVPRSSRPSKSPRPKRG